MGSNLSVTQSKVLQAIENVTKTSCKNRQSVDQDISNLRVELSGAARCGNIEITNEASLMADCNMENFAKALAAQSMELTVNQTAGLTLPLSFNVSMSQQERESVIKQILEQECGNEQAVKQKLKNNVVTVSDQAACDAIRIANTANLTAQCVTKTVLDALTENKDVVKVTQVAEVSMWAILAIMVPILIFFGVLYFVFRKKPQPVAGVPRKGAMKRPPGPAPTPASRGLSGISQTLGGLADTATKLKGVAGKK